MKKDIYEKPKLVILGKLVRETKGAEGSQVDGGGVKQYGGGGTTPGGS